MQKTDYSEVVRLFADRAPDAGRRLHGWLQDPHKSAVVPFVQSAITVVPYGLTPTDVERTCNATEHALADVRRSDAESVPEVVDWHPSFAFEHVLHHTLESLGHLPTYQQFRSFCATDRIAREMLLAPALTLRGQLEPRYPKRLIDDAIRWRVGNAYLSFVRELYVIAVLRHEGLDARFHVLADVLFRVDCWVGDVCIVIYVKNRKFRSGSVGRKPEASRILQGSGLRVEPLELETRHEFGTVHLPERREILEVASSLV